MRDLFRGYYRPTQEEFDQLWSQGLVALDANVLLNLYRYSPTARHDLIQVLTDYADRLWLPLQAAGEYQKNRLKVMFDQFETYREFRNSAEQAQKNLTAFVKTIPRHPTIDAIDVQSRIEDLSLLSLIMLRNSSRANMDSPWTMPAALIRFKIN